MKYATKEAVTNGTRPQFCDAFMGRYCAAHGNDSPSNQDLCACLSANTSNVICVSAKCTNASNAWVTDQMYSKQGNCGIICQQYINGETNDGNVIITGNDFTMKCGNVQGSGTQSNSVPWWSYITGDGYANSPGAPLPDINTKYWWGHWKESTNSTGHIDFVPSFSPTVIIGLVILGLTVLTLFFFIIRRIWAAAAPSSSPSPSTAK